MKTNINELFKIAVAKKASDLHILVGKPPILRIDGELYDVPNMPALTREDTKGLVFDILTPQQEEKFIVEKELDFSYEIKGLSRFRVNAHWEKGQVGLVARVISSLTPTMAEVLMPPVVFELLKERQGLILVTGPTGCGKSTSLAAMIDYINNERKCHIVTLEDPIEFLYPSKKSIIIQRQLGNDILSFAQALKHVVRQDPNVILVGEMRDLETIATTITLAETGHLVLATLHTYNASQTIDRIIDVFPPYQQPQIRLQLSLFLKAVISQQLVPRIKGGRIAVREILINTPAVGNLIRENKIGQIKTAIQTSADVGMVSMDQDLKRLCLEGLISEKTAISHMVSPESFKR